MPKLVSLAMTVYNRENYLSQALDSILVQTYPHWQLIIWDDGSTDSSPDIAKYYARLDPRIYFICAPHTGRQHALRAAIQRCASRRFPPHEGATRQATDRPYLAWVDSDDLLAPDALAATVNILDRHPTVGMVYTNHSIIDTNRTCCHCCQECSTTAGIERSISIRSF
jgi:glycosyltransferase involved in cell wall biosynthesis